MGDRERLAALEAEVAALKAKISPAPRPAPLAEEGVVRITTVMRAERDMPSEDEYDRLLSIVQRTSPRVVGNFADDRYGSAEKYRAEFLGKFISCFQRLESLWRFTDNGLGRSRAEYWVNETNTMLGVRSDVGLSHVMAAAIAWGDVNYSLGNWPYDVYLGLSYSTGDDIRSASSAPWRKVLVSGVVRPSIVTQEQQHAARTSDVRIYAG
jgi:hypothetical protein